MIKTGNKIWMEDCNLCVRHGKEGRRTRPWHLKFTKIAKVITAHFFSFLLGNQRSTIIPGLFLVSNNVLNIKNALNSVCVGTFLFPGEDKINHHRCSIARGDSRGFFRGRWYKRLQQRCRKQVRRKWTSKIKEDPLTTVDIITALPVGTGRFTRIFTRSNVNLMQKTNAYVMMWGVGIIQLSSK